MGTEQTRIVMMLSILGRGKGKSYISMLNSKGIRYHMQSVGYGTASSEMMDILGLGSNNKDVVVSYATDRVVGDFVAEYSKNLDTTSRYGGIMMVLPLSAINRLTAEVISRADKNTTEKGNDNDMKSEHKHYVIFITVNQGFSDEVMQTARKAGSTGGTVIRARLAGDEKFEQLGDADDISEEKEIITILAPENTCSQIMEAVNKEFGLMSKARGIVCSVPVEKALKI
ncbi:MAG: hypothetical protein J6L92_02885 [Clostridia bacterium]|nr:hypothetical protein [Clostridia bacterium]